MYRIRNAEFLAPQIKRLEIEAPSIALRRKPGQFIILRLHEGGERIPLTIVDSTAETITLIVQGIGKTTKELNHMEAGDELLDIVGPLGKPTVIEHFGTVVTIGGGVGTAIAYPITVALKKAGNHTISIVGGRNKDLVILESELRAIADEVIVTTDDGSYGQRGLVIDPLKQMLQEGRKIDHVVAIGPIRMMKAVADVTRPFQIETIVSLNPIMVDGTGMCGGCRAEVDGRTQFVCVDGPEFDAHKVNFELLEKRNQAYRNFERKSLERYECAASVH